MDEITYNAIRAAMLETAGIIAKWPLEVFLERAQGENLIWDECLAELFNKIKAYMEGLQNGN